MGYGVAVRIVKSILFGAEGGRQFARRLATTAILALVGASPVWAARTDVVHLKNGDRVTCSVKELDRGRLRVTTDHMGTIFIDWAHVSSIDTVKTFEVELDDGSRYFGSLFPGDSDGGLIVDQGQSASEVRLAYVVQITEIKRGFLRRLEGSIDFGFNFQKTDNDVNYSLSGEVIYRSRNAEVGIDYRSILSNRDDQPRAFRNVLNAVYDRSLSNRWHVLGLGRMEQNDELGLDLRTNLGAAASRIVIKSNRNRLSVIGGLTTNRERYILDPDTTTSLEALFATSYDFFIHGDLGADLSASLTVLPSLTESGRYRLELDARYRHEIVLDLSVSFSGWYSFDSKAPISETETVRQTDYGIVASLGWSF